MSGIKYIWDIIVMTIFVAGFFLRCGFQMLVFFPLYILLCPYFSCENPTEEDHYNYLNHFENLI